MAQPNIVWDTPDAPPGVVWDTPPAVSAQPPPQSTLDWLGTKAGVLAEPVAGKKPTTLQRLQASDTGRILQGGVVDPAAGIAQLIMHAGGGAGALSPVTAAASGVSDVADLARSKLGLKPWDLYGQATHAVDNTISGQNAGYEGSRAATGQTGFDWGRLGGNIVSPINALGGEVTAAATPAKTFIGGLARSIPVGAAFGALQPVTDPNDFLKQKAIQTGVGAVAGPVAHGLGSLVGSGAMAAKALTAPLFAGSERNVVGDILNKTAGSRGVTFEPPPVAGMMPTTAAATNNDGLISLERALQQRQGIDMQVSPTRATNTAALRQAMGTLGDVNADPAAMSDQLLAQRDAAQAAMRAKWKAAGIDDATGVMTTPLKDAIGQWYDGLSKTDRGLVPPTLFKSMSEFEPTENFREIQDFRRSINQETSKAFDAGDENLGRILMGAKKVVGDFADNPPLDMSAANSRIFTDPDFNAKYQAARDATRQYHAMYSTPDTVGKVVTGKVAPSQVASQFIQPNKPELFQSYLNASGGPGRQAARDAFAQKFLDAAQTTATDVQGNRELSSPAITNFVDNYRHVINSDLYTPAQQSLFDKIQQGADMAARTSRPVARGGSDTASKLMGNQFVDALIGPAASNAFRNTAAGLGVAGALALHANPVMAAGALGTGLVASAGANPIMRAMYAAPRDRAMALLAEAMRDPALAQTLMRTAKPGAESFMPAVMKSKIMNILTPAVASGSGGIAGRPRDAATAMQQVQPTP